MIQIDMPIPKCCDECMFCFSHGAQYSERGTEIQYLCEARYRMDKLSGKDRKEFEYKYDFPQEIADKGRQDFCPLKEVKETDGESK